MQQGRYQLNETEYEALLDQLVAQGYQIASWKEQGVLPGHCAVRSQQGSGSFKHQTHYDVIWVHSSTTAIAV